MIHHPISPPPTGDPVPWILRHWLQDLRACFTAPSWEHVLVLVMGAVLAPGKRTVSACLRMTGRAEATNFSSYHQILNRARWDTHAMARRLLIMIIDRLVPDGRSCNFTSGNSACVALRAPAGACPGRGGPS